LPFEKWVFRNGHPVCDDYRRLFIAMTSTLEQSILVWVAFVLAAELCPENQYTGHIAYELSNLSSGWLRWCCWNIDTSGMGSWLLEKWIHHVCRRVFL